MLPKHAMLQVASIRKACSSTFAHIRAVVMIRRICSSTHRSDYFSDFTVGAALMLWALSGFLLISGVQAQAPDTCIETLSEAEGHYTNSEYEAAVQYAVHCLAHGAITQEATARAYRLIGQARLKQGNRAAAREAIHALLQADPAFNADPVQDPPSYVTFVREVRAEAQALGRLPEPVEAKPSWVERRRTWVAIGSSLVVGGLVTLFAGG